MGYQADTLQIELKENYAIVTLDNGKVNAINTALLIDMNRIFDVLAKDDNVEGVILTGRPHVFSAGLDVMHLATLDSDGRISFWEYYMELMRSMVTLSKPLICAITGYAPAGATILTLCTDYRIMGKGPKHVMGMHEFKMSMQIPEMLCDVYAYHLGEKNAWKAVQNAQLYNSDAAMMVGLIDESLEVDEVLPRAEEYLKKLMKVFYKVYGETKKFMTKELRSLVMDRDIGVMAREFNEFSSDPELQAKVVEFMMKLKKK